MTCLAFLASRGSPSRFGFETNISLKTFPSYERSYKKAFTITNQMYCRGKLIVISFLCWNILLCSIPLFARWKNICNNRGSNPETFHIKLLYHYLRPKTDRKIRHKLGNTDTNGHLLRKSKFYGAGPRIDPKKYLQSCWQDFFALKQMFCIK